MYTCHMFVWYWRAKRARKNDNNKVKTTVGPPLLPIIPPHKTPPLTNLRGGPDPRSPPLDPRLLYDCLWVWVQSALSVVCIIQPLWKSEGLQSIPLLTGRKHTVCVSKKYGEFWCKKRFLLVTWVLIWNILLTKHLFTPRNSLFWHFKRTFTSHFYAWLTSFRALAGFRAPPK